MQQLYFVTSNPGKVESLQAIANDLAADVQIEMLSAEYPENKSDDRLQTVALEGAKYCAEKYQKPVLVTDTGIFISALKGFPGINTAFTLKRVGTEGLLKLMEGVENREVWWELSLGYCEPGNVPEEFTARVRGEIASKARGSQGFGFDPIFIPENSKQTLAENTALRDSISPLREAMKNFFQAHRILIS